MAGSIRAQTSVALAIGVVIVLMAGVLIAGWTVSRSESGTRDGFEAAIVVLSAAAETLPADAWAGLAEAAERVGVTMRAATGHALTSDVYTDAMADRLRSGLEPLGASLRAAGHQARGEPSALGRLWGHAGDIVVRVALSGGDTVEFVRTGHWSVPEFLLQAMPVIVVVGGGLALLSVWVARRVTAPLERFAAAAERLGRDVRSAPLDESGPREIESAARVLNRAQQRIRRLLDDRTQMLAAIAHDLRTPIMRLYLRAELLPDPDQQARMQRDLAEMEAMIDGALTFAREETVVEEREPVPLHDLLGDVRDALTDNGLGVTIVSAEPVIVPGSPARLKRALGNLIENAARYGNSAQVTWRALPERAEVVIEDSGPGIPDDELERVFTPFYRLEPSRSRQSGGTGLGLTVARSIVRGHGGEIRLENLPGGGLRQTVSLPRPDR